MRYVGARELGYFAEAAVMLAVATAAIRWLPFRRLQALMSGKFRTRRTNERGGTPLVIQAVHRASRRLPLRTVCFQEGLAAHWMLRRRGLPSRLHYGIRQDGAVLTAHVWVTVAGERVIGREAPGQSHAEVAVYP